MDDQPFKPSTLAKVNSRLDTLFWKFTIQTYPSLAGVINLAFSNGGFCAGGYPRSIHDVFTGKSAKTTIGLGSDVDLFFRTKEGLERFIAGVRASTKLRSFTVTPSVGNLAIDIAFRGIDGLPDNQQFYNVQAITAYYGSPEEVIGSFDFANCMVGFEKETVYMGDRFQENERDGTLEIINWREKSLMYRVQKYVVGHGYKKMHPSCQKQFVSWMFDRYFALNEVETTGTDTENRNAFRGKVRNIMNKEGIVDDADLLLLCSLFEGVKNKTYADVFSELTRRKRQTQKQPIGYDDLVHEAIAVVL